jgi:hypothetical protein
VYPQRLVYIGRRFGTLCRVHLQRLEVDCVNLLDSWDISGQGHFTLSNDLFPRKISNNFNGCPIKAVVRVTDSELAKIFVYHMYSNDNVRKRLENTFTKD